MHTSHTDGGWIVVLGNRRSSGDRQAEPAPGELGVPWTAPLRRPHGDAARHPTALEMLSWRARATPLIGRDAELEALLDWARDGGPVRVRFLRGPAGTGKTRLAAEVAVALAREGWSAGFVAWTELETWRVGPAGALLILDEPPQAGDRRWLDLAGTIDDTFEAAPPRRLLILDRESDRQEPLHPGASIQELGALSDAAARRLYASTKEIWSSITSDARDAAAPADAWSAETDTWRRPLHVMVAALSPPAADGADDRDAFMALAHTHYVARLEAEPRGGWAVISGLLAPGCGESLSGAALAGVVVRRALDGRLDGNLALPVTACELARLDRLLADGGVSTADGDRLASVYQRYRPYRDHQAFVAQIDDYLPRPGSLLGRIALLEARTLANWTAHDLIRRLLSLAAQLDRELGPAAALEVAEEAASLCRGLDLADADDLIRGRIDFDCVWMLAHYHEQLGSSRGVELRREATQFGPPVAEAGEERILAYRLLGECTLASDTERLAALRLVAGYHRHGDATLLLALTLERLARLAPPDEGRALLEEAAEIRSGLPAAEAAWFADSSGDAAESGPGELTLSLVLATHLERVRRYASDPAVRRYLAGQLEHHTAGIRVAGGSQAYLQTVDRYLWQPERL